MPRRRPHPPKGRRYCPGGIDKHPHFALIEDFRRPKTDGYCIFHTNEYQRVRDRRTQRNRHRYTYARVQVLAAYGAKCAECGEDDPDVLQIDHIIRTHGKIERANYRSRGYLRKIIRAGYPDDYQLLCLNCHRKKHREQPRITQEDMRKFLDGR